MWASYVDPHQLWAVVTSGLVWLVASVNAAGDKGWPVIVSVVAITVTVVLHRLVHQHDVRKHTFSLIETFHSVEFTRSRRGFKEAYDSMRVQYVVIERESAGHGKLARPVYHVYHARMKNMGAFYECASAQHKVEISDRLHFFERLADLYEHKLVDRKLADRLLSRYLSYWGLIMETFSETDGEWKSQVELVNNFLKKYKSAAYTGTR